MLEVRDFARGGPTGVVQVAGPFELCPLQMPVSAAGDSMVGSVLLPIFCGLASLRPGPLRVRSYCGTQIGSACSSLMQAIILTHRLGRLTAVHSYVARVTIRAPSQQDGEVWGRPACSTALWAEKTPESSLGINQPRHATPGLRSIW